MKQMSNRTKGRRHGLMIAAFSSLALALGCGGGGGPTAPSMEVPASIAGQVVDSAASTANDPVTGVTVRIEGTTLSTTTDAQGRFSLTGVPMGDQVLAFEQGGQTAGLAVDDIQPAEAIDMVVALFGSTVQVQSMTRGGGGGAAVILEKATNGEDADRPPGPSIGIGSPVSWTYVVTNSGAVELSRIEVSDDQGVVVSCPQTILAPGASMTCTGDGFAIAGQYANLGMVAAVDSAGSPVSAEDPSHYFGTDAGPSVDIEKSTNGEDADRAPGPTIPVGDPISWEYVVTNDGGVELVDIVVLDDQGVVVSCPQTSLSPGASMTCTGGGIAIEGQYANLGTVTASDGKGLMVDDSDMSHYLGQVADDEPLSVEIQSDRWNTNWPTSSGTVSAKIRGGDLTTIDPSTILMFESDPLVFVEPTSVPGITGNHIRARFSKAEAFAILDNPQSGETRTVTVQFVAGGLLVELQADIEIVGPPI